jgi:hypothetical protein
MTDKLFSNTMVRISYIRVMVLTATFNNISVISWRSFLLVEETGLPGENHRPAASSWQTLSHNIVSSTSRLRTNEYKDIGRILVNEMEYMINMKTSSYKNMKYDLWKRSCIKLNSEGLLLTIRNLFFKLQWH